MNTEYDIIILGATGYTGKLTAEHIATHLPTNLRWAVAGRSKLKLDTLVHDLRGMHQDRIQPGIEITTLTPDDLGALVRKTKVLINTVGPYHLYSSPVVEACAQTGTNYLDVTGESPWILDMIHKHHQKAVTNGAIIIPGIGLESAPSDLLAWSLVKTLRDQCHVDTKDVTATLHEISSMPSGGTLATVLGIFDTYGLKEVAASGSGRWLSSPVPGTNTKSGSIWSTIFGVRYIPELGILSSSLNAGPNVAVVQRSWGLQDGGKAYGSHFQYHEYMTVPNRMVGMLFHFGLALGALALSLAPVRWILKRLIYAPGQGRSKQATQKDYFEMRGLATADEEVTAPRRAFGRMRYDGSIYYFTGVLLAEAAMVLLNEHDLTNRLKGGLLTPAMLGQPFVDRMDQAGLHIETRILAK